MHIAEDQKKVFWAFVIMLPLFIIAFIIQKNYEFIGYVVVVLILFAVLLYSNKHVMYPTYVIWGLFVWAFLHMLGGVEFAPDRVIYTLKLLPIVDEPYNILKYDQVVHAYGFFVGALVMYYVLEKYLKRPFNWLGVGVVVAMAGLGLGALNEIIEFLMTVTLPNTNVGGYENTALDLVSNFIGAVLAIYYLRYRESK